MSKINTTTILLIEFKSINDLYFFNNQIQKTIKINAQYLELKNKLIGIIKLSISLNKFIPFIKEFGIVKKINKVEIAYIKEYGKVIKL